MSVRTNESERSIERSVGATSSAKWETRSKIATESAESKKPTVQPSTGGENLAWW